MALAENGVAVISGMARERIMRRIEGRLTAGKNFRHFRKLSGDHISAGRERTGQENS